MRVARLATVDPACAPAIDGLATLFVAGAVMVVAMDDPDGEGVAPDGLSLRAELGAAAIVGFV
jgi:hypothetical protein